MIDEVLKYEKRLFAQVMAQERAISALFDDFTRSVAPLLRRYRTESGVKSVWIRNREIEAAIDAQLRRLQTDLSSYLNSQTVKAWDLSHKKTDAIVGSYIKGLALSETAIDGLFFRNIDALKAFQNRIEKGFSVSQRIWKTTQEMKQQMELYLQSGLSTGRSAAQISRDVRGFLQDPDKRFRRVRDPETGKLKASVPMKNYHPGQGKYRSAYKNALRMTRTETNMAYRLSDQVRWKNIDFITGYEVKLSAAHPVFDICDSMIGEYPKNFIFSGWHPNCYCYSVPVMVNQDNFVEYINTGKLPAHERVKGIPPRAFNYVKDRADKLSAMANKPYWLQDNFTKKNGSYFPKVGISKPPDMPGVIRNNPLPTPYKAVESVESNIRLNSKESGHVFNMSGELIYSNTGNHNSVAVIESRPGLFKDTIFTHNHPSGVPYAGTKDIRRIGNSFSVNDILVGEHYNIAEVRAVTPEMNFIMKRPVNGWPKRDVIITEYNKQSGIVQNILYSRIQNNTLTIKQANTVHYHWVWKRVAKELGLTYIKKGI